MTEVHAAGCHNGGMENNVLYTLGIYVSSPFFVHRVITTSGVCWLACLLALYLHCNKTFRCLYSGDTIITIQRGCTVSYSRMQRLSLLCYYTIPRISVRIHPTTWLFSAVSGFVFPLELQRCDTVKLIVVACLNIAVMAKRERKKKKERSDYRVRRATCALVHAGLK
jgi:hypothetical protein